jgi:hypothetical protein
MALKTKKFSQRKSEGPTLRYKKGEFSFRIFVYSPLSSAICNLISAILFGPAVLWISIHLAVWRRIRFRIENADPDPGVPTYGNRPKFMNKQITFLLKRLLYL